MAMDLEAGHAQVKDYQHKMGRLISRAWADPAFKAKVDSNPKAALREVGIHVPDDVEVDNIPIPPRPDELSDEQLGAATAADGSCAGSSGSLTCPSCSAGTAGCAH